MALFIAVRNKKKGFTLLEVLVVIIILSFITIGGSTFFITLVNGQLVVDRQSALLVDSELAFMRIAKQLRTALPYSPVITNKQHCLKFIPVLGHGFYKDNAKAIDIKEGNNKKISVFINSTFVAGVKNHKGSVFLYTKDQSHENISSNFYEQKIRSINSYYLGVDSVVNEGVNRGRTITKNYSFGEEFYLLARPSAFCLLDNELRYYKNIASYRETINTSEDYSVISKFVKAPPFKALSVKEQPRKNAFIFSTYNEANQCVHCVTINMTFTQNNANRKALNDRLSNKERVAVSSNNSIDYFLNKTRTVWLRYGF